MTWILDHCLVLLLLAGYTGLMAHPPGLDMRIMIFAAQGRQEAGGKLGQGLEIRNWTLETGDREAGKSNLRSPFCNLRSPRSGSRLLVDIPTRENQDSRVTLQGPGQHLCPFHS